MCKFAYDFSTGITLNIFIICGKAGVPLPDNLMVWRIGGKIGHNRTIVCDFKESDGIRRTLTCQTRSDGLHPIIHFYHRRNALWDKHNKNRTGSEQT